MNCPHCGSNKVQSRGERNGLKRYHCQEKGCFRWFSEEYPENENYSKLANILLFDIEVSPLTATVWQTGKQVIRHEQIVSEQVVISWSAKWLYGSEIFGDVLTPKEALERNDKRIIEKMWNFLDSSDIVVGHNIRNFDVKKLNTRFLINGMNPPSYFRVVDTLEQAKANFYFTSNSLNYICKVLDLPTKKENGGLETWIKCMKGDKDALSLMYEYNKVDVLINEEVYIKLRPYMRNHPNVNTYGDCISENCPNCGSEEIKKEGFYFTNVAKYYSYRCQECGSLSRGRVNLLTKEQRKKILGV